MATVPIPARHVVTTFDAASKHEQIDVKPLPVRIFRRIVTGVFSLWAKISTTIVTNLNWRQQVEPYVGYGTSNFSRLICRTVYEPLRRKPGALMRGWRGMLAVPAPKVKVKLSIDGVPVETVQVGTSEVYDRVDRFRERSID